MSTVVDSDDADYVTVSVIGGVATADLAVGTPAIADCTDTASLTAVSAAGTADPLMGAARGTAAEKNSPAVVGRLPCILAVLAGICKSVDTFADQASLAGCVGNSCSSGTCLFVENGRALQRLRARPCRLM